MPSGAIGDCGRIPSIVATCRVGRRWIDVPSSSTAPRLGLSRRARARSSVDLPHAFGPTMTVIRPVGWRPRGAARPRRCVVGEAEILAGERCRCAVALVIGHGHPPRPARLERAISHSRYGAPTMPVTTPTGSSVGANSRRATRSEQHDSSAPTSAAGHERQRVARQPAGDRRGDERDEDDRSGGGGGDAARATATNTSARRTARRGRRGRVAASSPSCSMRNGRSQGDDGGSSTTSATATGGRAPSPGRSGCPSARRTPAGPRRSRRG